MCRNWTVRARSNFQRTRQSYGRQATRNASPTDENVFDRAFKPCSLLLVGEILLIWGIMGFNMRSSGSSRMIDSIDYLQRGS